MAVKSVYVTGGRTGFLGANFVKAFLARKDKVLAQSCDPDKKRVFASDDVENIDNLTEYIGGVTLTSGSMRIGPTLDQFDHVVHCAAHTSGAYEMVHNPEAQIHENAFMNSRLLDAAAKEGIKKFIFISSSAVYPNWNGPLREEWGFLKNPPPCYFGPAWMKRYSEKLCQFYSKDMEMLIIRPSNVYGPYSGFDPTHSHVIPALIRKFVEGKSPIEIWGTSDVERDFIYVDDFVTGVLAAFEKFSKLDTYNIATGKNTTMQQLVETIAKLTDYKGEIVYNADKPVTIHKRAIDPFKAREELGFEATTTLEDGLKNTINWYKENVEH